MFLRSARATNHWSAQHLEGGMAASRSAKVSLNSCRLEKNVIAEGYRIFNDESYLNGGFNGNMSYLVI